MNVDSSGTQSCTVTTEHDLATITAIGVYAVTLDLNASANGSTPDEFVLKEYEKVLSGGTERLIQTTVIARGATGFPIIKMVPRPIAYHYRVSLTQTQGTSRSVPWRIDKLS